MARVVKKGGSKSEFRFYAELNDFLPPGRRYRSFSYLFHGSPAIKDAIEALGVPHGEVEVILVEGISVDFQHRLRGGERAAVYPVFESLDISPLIRLRGKPLRRTAFILDVHLGKLARRLRTLGFDTLYRNDYEDSEIIRLALKEKRIILTRDVGLLKTGLVTHGYWVRSQKALDQAREVLKRFDLYRSVKPFRRCPVCNGLLIPVEKEKIILRLQPRTALHYQKFRICSDCGKIYWQGSHYPVMEKLIRKMTAEDS